MSNTITITGNLGKDPELKYVGANGLPVCELSIGATPRKLNKTTNEWENRGAPQWYRVTAFENEAEAWTEAFSKGDKITATGTMVVEEYTTKDGRDGYTLTIVNATVGKVPHAQKQPQNAPYGANRGTPAPQHGQPTPAPVQGDQWTQPQAGQAPF